MEFNTLIRRIISFALMSTSDIVYPIKHSHGFAVLHYNDVIMSPMASQITGASIVYSTVCSATDQRKHQSSASSAFVERIQRGPVNSLHKGPVTRKMFPFWWRHHIILLPLYHRSGRVHVAHHILQDCFTGIWTIVRWRKCRRSKSARLQYLQCVSDWDTVVLQAIDM